MKTLLNNAYYAIRFKLNSISAPAKKERGDQLIEVLGLVIVALIILVIFRKQLLDWVQNIFNQMGDYINDLFASNPLSPGDALPDSPQNP